MALPDRVLVDTSAFFALCSASDLFHSKASLAYERLIDREQELWTTSYTLVETIALLHRRLSFEVVLGVLGVAPTSKSKGAVDRQCNS